MVAHPADPAEDGADERDDRGSESGEDAGEGGGVGRDGDAREALQVAEDVPLRSGDGGDTATMMATAMAQIQTATPCLTPLKRAIRPAT